ncbi:MAG TPA: lactate racemase domain-containing protein [Terrimicrobiaceae bacterium]
MLSPVLSKLSAKDAALGVADVEELVTRACPASDYSNKKVLLIVPDATRTAPVDICFKALHEQLAGRTAAFDVMIALGTHQPMTEKAICDRLGITLVQRRGQYRGVQLINHEWQNPDALISLGTIRANEIHELSGGLFAMDVQVRVNRRLFDYDQLIIAGPVFPHEVVGFSGGNKYLFPGVSGPEVLNFFHWLGAIVTNPMIIGNKWTPVRKVVDRAGSMVSVPKLCFCLVVKGANLVGVFAGSPEAAWTEASELSRQLHIVYKEKPFSTILSCAPKMYDELWTGGKCMYKLEPVLADDGELIIYAPHISRVSATHGDVIEKIGYHCRDYFLKQWEKFKDYPWGTLAHSTHVRGIGKFDNGIEHCRAKVTLATRIPPQTCEKINLGYRDPDSIKVEEFSAREDEGVLLVRKAGEMLYQLREPAPWARAEG